VIEEQRDVTDGQLRALRELRFVTINRARTVAFGVDSDRARVEAVGFHALGYERAPGVWDYQCRLTHPRMLREVEAILGLDHG
jgi:hypothetical protein